ncbi:hypothetical protein BD410DRAFT_395916 [Rickenella mellea]|uniref:Uncharacterized protein n=1 Tax=Rickenella mellea TaxID=50990 RepID=A0A4Y7PY27_9AGAM|nr:hypothetical protein BD410DRAFT_395916 [Rickenella mellea]
MKVWSFLHQFSPTTITHLSAASLHAAAPVHYPQRRKIGGVQSDLMDAQLMQIIAGTILMFANSCIIDPRALWLLRVIVFLPIPDKCGVCCGDPWTLRDNLVVNQQVWICQRRP